MQQISQFILSCGEHNESIDTGGRRPASTISSLEHCLCSRIMNVLCNVVLPRTKLA
jgi:hypothetical protein